MPKLSEKCNNCKKIIIEPLEWKWPNNLSTLECEYCGNIFKRYKNNK